MNEELEDGIADVLRKAIHGTGLDPAESNFEPSDPDSIRMAARLLGLGEAALLGLPDYRPEPLDMPSIQRLALPFHAWTVNAWLLHGPEGSLLFDTGCSPEDLESALTKKRADIPLACLITHGHHDHVGGIPLLRQHQVEVLGADQLTPGTRLMRAGLELVTHDLSGHFSPALGYKIHGLPRPVLVVGDALFAGSMGKFPNPEAFRMAIQTLSRALASCSEETILLPGHGPATSLREERIHNPFLTGRFF